MRGRGRVHPLRFALPPVHDASHDPPVPVRRQPAAAGNHGEGRGTDRPYPSASEPLRHTTGEGEPGAQRPAPPPRRRRGRNQLLLTARRNRVRRRPPAAPGRGAIPHPDRNGPPSSHLRCQRARDLHGARADPRPPRARLTHALLGAWPRRGGADAIAAPGLGTADGDELVRTLRRTLQLDGCDLTAHRDGSPRAASRRWASRRTRPFLARHPFDHTPKRYDTLAF